MGNAVNGFEEGASATRVFFPVLVTGWDLIRPTLVRWGVEAPAVLDGDTVYQVVKFIRSDAIAKRYADAVQRGNVWDIPEAKAVDYLAIAWEQLAKAAARYERRRRQGQPTAMAWLMAHMALGSFNEAVEQYRPHLEA